MPPSQLPKYTTLCRVGCQYMLSEVLFWHNESIWGSLTWSRESRNRIIWITKKSPQVFTVAMSYSCRLWDQLPNEWSYWHFTKLTGPSAYTLHSNPILATDGTNGLLWLVTYISQTGHQSFPACLCHPTVGNVYGSPYVWAILQSPFQTASKSSNSTPWWQ